MHDPERQKFNLELGERLAVARKGAHKSVQEAADHLRVPVDSYLKWERGDRQFPMHLILAFCLLTGFSPGFIVTGFPNGDWRKGDDTGTFIEMPEDDGE